MRKDKLFLIVLSAALVVLVLFGLATLWLSLDDPTPPEKAVTGRVVGSFTGMFTSIIAFAVGYLTGKNGNGGSDDPPDAAVGSGGPTRRGRDSL